MTFIEEIQPYIERIKLHQQGGNITNIETLRAIRDIHFKYIRSKDFNIPSNLGCGNCVRQMINQLVGEIGRQEKAMPTYELKIEEDSDIKIVLTDNTDSKFMTFPNQERKPLKAIPITKQMRVKESMKWGAFKKYCTSKGLKVKGKTREVLENELKGL